MQDGAVAVQSRLSWGNADARAALGRYDALVQTIARRLAPAARMGQALDREDLWAEGRIAVLEALRTYQGFGIEERTWVATRIRQRMIDAIRRLDTRSRDEIRLSVSQDAEPPEASAAHDQASEQAVERRERVRVLSARRLVSLDSSNADAEPLSARLHDHYVRPADEVADQNALQRRLRRAIEGLPERQRTAIELSLFEGLPLREIGDRMGVTESRVCQLHKRAVEMLRRALSVSLVPAAQGALHAA